jgi:hypothetical protein
VCRDPDDDYLVSLMRPAAAHLLVSGDRALQDLELPGVEVRSPRDALEAITYSHPWGDALIPGTAEAAWRQAEAEGNADVLRTAAVFLTVLEGAGASDVLPVVTTPESLPAWREGLCAVRELLAGRGMAGRVEYPSVDVAYVKLPPDPGEHVMATAEVLLPEETVMLTLQRRPDLPDELSLGGWRVHGAGAPVLPEQMPVPGAGRG